MPAKQDLALYKELKSIKADFDKEINNVKSNIKTNNFKKAKTGLSNCDKYINNMENIIDKLPDKTTADTVKRLVPIVVSILGSVITSVANDYMFKNYKSKESNIVDELNNNIDNIRKENEKYKQDVENKKSSIEKQKRKINRNWDKIDYDIDKMRKHSEKFCSKNYKYNTEEEYLAICKKDPDSHIMDKYNRIRNLRLENTSKLDKELKTLEKEYEEMLKNEPKHEEMSKKIDNCHVDALQKHRLNDGEYVQKSHKNINNISKLTASGIIGSSVILLTLKPLKSKAKSILNKCKKKIDETRKYLDKVEKMSKSVKESFDETLDSIYNAFTEGTIDEFEYDTLIDHLLS